MSIISSVFPLLPARNARTGLSFKKINRSVRWLQQRSALLCLSFLFASASLFAQVSFSTKTDFNTGNGPFYVSINDLNGDSKPDMAVVNNIDNTVSILFNITLPGATTAAYSPKSDFLTGSSPRSVCVGDLNGDGKLDLAVTNIGDQTVSILLSSTISGGMTASYSAKTDFMTGVSPSSVSIGDVNGDGKPDLTVVNSDDNTVSVFLNRTNHGDSIPIFSLKSDFATGKSPTSVSIGDLNGDGKADLISANNNDSTVSLLVNATMAGDSVPSFLSKVDITTGNGPFSVSNSDLNGDGKTDLVVANNNIYTVSILFNTTIPGASIPTFSKVTDFTTGLSPRSVSIGDLNGDNKPDVAVANNGAQSISILLNTTNQGEPIPSFSRKTGYAVGNAQRSISIADLNADGKSDLVVVNYYENTVSVLLNDTTTLFSVVALSHSTLDFGLVNTGHFKDSTVTITNTGTDTLKITSISTSSGMFSTNHSVATILPNSSFVDTLRFSPPGTSGYNGIFLVTSNAASSPDTIRVAGTGQIFLSVNRIHGEVQTYSLYQNYPNPYNPTTMITYQLPKEGHVLLNVYDVLGKNVATLVDQRQSAGMYTAFFDASTMSSGLYFYRLTIGSFIETKKMMVMK